MTPCQHLSLQNSSDLDLTKKKGKRGKIKVNSLLDLS